MLTFSFFWEGMSPRKKTIAVISIGFGAIAGGCIAGLMIGSQATEDIVFAFAFTLAISGVLCYKFLEYIFPGY